MNPTIHLRIVGILLLLLAALHGVFPKRFKWKEELARLSLLNRQIFLVHDFFIVLLLIMMGFLSTFFTSALLQPTPLGRLVLGGLVIFSGLRLLVQWFGYDRRLWWGSPFNATVHFIFSAMWVYLVFVYAYALFLQFHPA